MVEFKYKSIELRVFSPRPTHPKGKGYLETDSGTLETQQEIMIMWDLNVSFVLRFFFPVSFVDNVFYKLWDIKN